MKKEEIHLWDVKRILLGQAPPEFLLEVLIRSLVVYITAIVVMRWMGKRMNGQLSIVELSVMVMMGAIVSVPMQLPDRGIFQGLVVLFTTLFCLRSINWISFKSQRFEKTVQGELTVLVKDGVLVTEEVNAASITRQQLYGELRSKKIYNLGKVKRMYLEACGTFSVYEEKQPRAGLPLFPPTDPEMYGEQAPAGSEKACCSCGKMQPVSAAACSNCGAAEWTNPVL